MRICIVEDNEPTRNRLVSLLDGKNGITVTEAAASAERALQTVECDPPDVVILDLGLPGLSGVDAITAFRAKCPSAEILVFTVMYDDDQVFAALRAGASGYILKDAHYAQILAAVEELKSGGAPMSFSIARKVLKEFQGLPGQDALRDIISPLSAREADIIGLLYKGDSYKEIADKLSLSIHTVHTHIKNIYVKLHVNSRAQAIYEACRKNLIRQ